jgi:hypothetical protein
MNSKENFSNFKKIWRQHKQGQVGELYRLQLTGYSRWIEEKLLELLNQNNERSNRY